MVDPLVWRLTDSDLLQAVEWARRRVSTSVDRKDMPKRSLIQRLDDKLMGDAATIGMRGYLKSLGRRAVCYDEIRNDGSVNIDPGWDLLSGTSNDQYEIYKRENSAIISPELVTYSIKSSRIPKGYSLNDCISKLDFKILKYGRTIMDDLKADFEVQVYFSADTRLPPDVDVDRARCLLGRSSQSRSDARDLLTVIRGERFREMFLCTYISRPALAQRWRQCERSGQPTVQRMRLGSQVKEIWTAKLAWGEPLRGKES